MTPFWPYFGVICWVERDPVGFGGGKNAPWMTSISVPLQGKELIFLLVIG